MTFTVGQRVRCVTGHDVCGLFVNATYTVSKIVGYWLYFDKLPIDVQGGWSAGRFVAVDDQQPDPYPGQRMAPQPIPATAQAILDIGKATRSAGIARAVSGLNSFEPRLGAARWVP